MTKVAHLPESELRAIVTDLAARLAEVEAWLAEGTRRTGAAL